MPFGDRTGPLGQGPMTGRGRGYCSGNATPGRFNAGPGRGMGRAGRGGPGWRNQFRAAGMNDCENPAPAPSASADRPQEVAALRSAIDEMRSSLNQIRNRIRARGQACRGRREFNYIASSTK